ncbi:MAG: phosphonate C-P lyase system protein PhnH [Fibrobacterota bacterium]
MKPISLYQTQAVFRVLLDSAAAPGKFFTAPRYDEGNGLILDICDTLLDHEVTFSVVGTEVNEDFIQDVILLTGAVYVEACDADYVIVVGGDSDGALENVRRGTLEYPETGATVIYSTQDLCTPTGIDFTVSGPGIKTPFIASVHGVARAELTLIRDINQGYPRGIDTIFCDGTAVVTLPRTTKIEFQERS